MNIKFWGVRGSIPSPLTPQQIQAKISAAIQRISAKDIESSDSREKFIASLPKWIYGTTGGNTPCVEVTSENGNKFIFDAGSGLRVLGKLGIPPENRHFNMFFSHFHWDHIQGFPFFDYAYNPSYSFDIYSPFPNMKEYLANQVTEPYYPVKWDAFTKNIRFHEVKEGEPFCADGFILNCVKMSHPGGSYAYSIQEKQKKLVYATDVELSSSDFEKTRSRAAVFENADVLILDSQYTVEEAAKKVNWGHSAFCYAVDFAVAWKIKKLYLFHHEPTYDDKKLNSILESARWYANYITQNPVKVYLSTEGLEIHL